MNCMLIWILTTEHLKKIKWILMAWMSVVVYWLHQRGPVVAMAAPFQIWSLGSSFQFCKQILSAELLFRQPAWRGGLGQWKVVFWRQPSLYQYQIYTSGGKISWDPQSKSLTQPGCKPWRIGQKGIQPQISISQAPAVIGHGAMLYKMTRGAKKNITHKNTARLTPECCE